MLDVDKIAFIGSGVMGEAIIKGILDHGLSTPERIVAWYRRQHLGPWSSESWSRLRWLGRYAQLQAFKFHGRPSHREDLQPPEPRPSFAGMDALSALDAG